jgi:hypothetical protein
MTLVLQVFWDLFRSFGIKTDFSIVADFVVILSDSFVQVSRGWLLGCEWLLLKNVLCFTVEIEKNTYLP